MDPLTTLACPTAQPLESKQIIMIIKLIDELTEKQTDRLFHWREQVFPVEGNDIKWAKS